MIIWKNLIVTWMLVLGAIILYSIAVTGGVNANDNSRYFGVFFWVITILVSIYPLGYLISKRQEYDTFETIKFFIIALLCPFIGSIYLFFKINKNKSI
ncbi:MULTISPECIES: hypothetical protein [unclassified Colwellia]|nr:MULTISPECIES: hypothetical protein [unclassified Colwellia]MBA6379206.1 hypothetical protein [Colwellia sp. BRX10-7]MBA6386048.1 hypothetical protein [Colwellia sp. BRX10-2]MBA6401979.1 hypothetical protein [Colwellia sp. BRX10-5]